MSYQTVAIRFHTLSLGNTVVCVFHCPEDKITQALDQRITSYVQKQHQHKLLIENIPLETLASESPKTDPNISILYVVEHTTPPISNMVDNHVTLMVVPKKEVSYEDDIVSLVLKKFMVVVLLVILFSWVLSKLSVEIGGEL